MPPIYVGCPIPWLPDTDGANSTPFRRLELVTTLETYTAIIVETFAPTKSHDMKRLVAEGTYKASTENENISELPAADVSSACNCLYSDRKIKPTTTKVVFKKTATLSSTTTTTEVPLAPTTV